MNRFVVNIPVHVFLLCLWNVCHIGKQRALSREVTCKYSLYLKLWQTSVKLSWKHWLFTSKYRCLHRGPFNTTYGWNRPSGNAQCSLFTYNTI